METLNKICFFQKVLRFYRRDFYHRILYNGNYEVTVVCEKYEFTLDSQKFDIYCYQKFDFNHIKFVFNILIESNIVVFPANLRLPQFIILGYILSLFNKKIFFLGHYNGKKGGSFADFLRCIFYTYPFKMLTYYKSESPKNIKVLPLENSVNTDSISIAKNKINYRHVSSRKLRIIFIGRDTEKARFDLYRLLANKLKKYDIVFHAVGPKEVKSDNIRYHGFINDEFVLAKLFSQIDLFLYPGNVGLSLIHLFHYQIPALIHSESNLHYPESSLFIEHFNGLTFKYNQLDDLTQKVFYIHENPKILMKFQNNLSTFMAINSSEIMASNFIKYTDN